MIAITRDVAREIASAELTHMERLSIDYRRAAEQHEEYRETLRALGVEVITIPADERHPDCVFIEDTAIVLDDVAVITRPGAESRRGEVDRVAEEVARIRPLARIEAPATIDGGDVLVLGERLYVGLSSRTNEAALEQLARLTNREVIAVTVTGALHLKTAITRVADDTLLVNRDWLDVAPFADWKMIEVDPEEPFAGNALLVRDTLIYPNAFVKTRAKLEAHSLNVRGVDADELAKAEGGVTCCCLLVARQ